MRVYVQYTQLQVLCVNSYCFHFCEFFQQHKYDTIASLSSEVSQVISTQQEDVLVFSVSTLEPRVCADASSATTIVHTFTG